MLQKSINYLISTNPHLILAKSKWKFYIDLNFFVTIYFANHVFSLLEMLFWEYIFSKEQRFDSGASLLLKSNILLSESSEVAIHKCSESF